MNWRQKAAFTILFFLCGAVWTAASGGYRTLRVRLASMRATGTMPRACKTNAAGTVTTGLWTAVFRPAMVPSSQWLYTLDRTRVHSM
jgi:hypothetical protein